MISDLNRRLAAQGRTDDHARELVQEAARIAVADIPRTSDRARQLALKRLDQTVLDPPAAGQTLTALEAELARIEPVLTRLRQRQDEIAAELGRLLEDDRER